MKHKVGRPTTTSSVAPPGQRYGKRRDHFVRKEEFRGSDNYCIACRKAYNKEYWEQNHKPKAEMEYLTVDISGHCTCGNYLCFADPGLYECPDCGKDWEVKYNLRITE